MKAGDLVTWCKTVSNYGHVHYIHGIIIKIGKKRITIQVPKIDGDQVLRHVSPENLELRKP